MIDIKRILDEPDLVAQNNKKRGVELDPTLVKSFYEKRIELTQSVESLRKRSNEIASQIPSARPIPGAISTLPLMTSMVAFTPFFLK